MCSCAQPPPGCSRYTVELRKPLGLVLEEDRHGSIFVVRDREVLFRVCLQTQPHCSQVGVTPGRRWLAGAQAGSLGEACGCGACSAVAVWLSIAPSYSCGRALRENDGRGGGLVA